MENAIPQSNLQMKKLSEDLNPEIEKIETEDEKIAQLHAQAGWEALKERLERKIKSIDESTKVSSNTISLIEDIQLYGFKCMAKDLLVEAYQSVIDDVELTYRVLKEKEDNDKPNEQ